MVEQPAAGGAAPAGRGLLKRWARPALQLSSLLLFGLILWLGGPESWRQLLASDGRLLLLAWLWTGLANMLAARRLQIVAEATVGRPVAAWRRFFHVSMTARALGLVLPRGVSLVGGKSVGLRALGMPIRRSLLAVVLDNLLDLLLLGALAVPSLFYLRGAVGTATYALLVAGAGAVVAAGVWWSAAPGRWRLARAWLGRLPLLREALANDDQASPLAEGVALRALGLTALLNGALVGQYAFIGAAVGLDDPWRLYLASFPLTQLSLVIAVAPGGLGLFDASWYGLLRLGGMDEAAAVTFVIAQRAFMFVFVLVWAGVSALPGLRGGTAR